MSQELAQSKRQTNLRTGPQPPFTLLSHGLDGKNSKANTAWNDWAPSPAGRGKQKVTFMSIRVMHSQHQQECHPQLFGVQHPLTSPRMNSTKNNNLACKQKSCCRLILAFRSSEPLADSWARFSVRSAVDIDVLSCSHVSLTMWFKSVNPPFFLVLKSCDDRVKGCSICDMSRHHNMLMTYELRQSELMIRNEWLRIYISEVSPSPTQDLSGCASCGEVRLLCSAERC